METNPLAYVERYLLNGNINIPYGQLAWSYSSYALSKRDPEQWDVSSQRYLQQIKEMYDMSSFNADEHLELEQEFVSYRQSSKKQWVRSLNGAMQELPEMLWGGPDATCS